MFIVNYVEARSKATTKKFLLQLRILRRTPRFRNVLRAIAVTVQVPWSSGELYLYSVLYCNSTILVPYSTTSVLVLCWLYGTVRVAVPPATSRFLPCITQKLHITREFKLICISMLARFKKYQWQQPT
jgi:hypothetical protein